MWQRASAVSVALGLALGSIPARAITTPLALAEASAASTLPDRMIRFGPGFSLPATAFQRTPIPDPGGVSELDSLYESGASVIAAGAGPVTLRARTFGTVGGPEGTPGFHPVSTATALFSDHLQISRIGGGPEQGLLTMRFRTNATVGIQALSSVPWEAYSQFMFQFESLTTPKAMGTLALFVLANASAENEFRRVTDQRGYFIDPDGRGDFEYVTLSDRIEEFDVLRGSPFLSFSGYSFDMVVPFFFGQPFDYRISVGCAIGARVFSSGNPEMTYFCNAGNSLALEGITAITDLLGRPVSGLRFRALSGLDYRLPAGAVIPEPRTWALMVAGFGLVGTRLRGGRARLARI
ncbi:hypothetical protein [Thermaurantiacus sp.]